MLATRKSNLKNKKFIDKIEQYKIPFYKIKNGFSKLQVYERHDTKVIQPALKLPFCLNVKQKSQYRHKIIHNAVNDHIKYRIRKRYQK